jgi:hypothetical protein
MTAPFAFVPAREVHPHALAVASNLGALRLAEPHGDDDTCPPRVIHATGTLWCDDCGAEFGSSDCCTTQERV